MTTESTIWQSEQQVTMTEVLEQERFTFSTVHSQVETYRLRKPISNSLAKLVVIMLAGMLSESETSMMTESTIWQSEHLTMMTEVLEQELYMFCTARSQTETCRLLKQISS